MQLVPISSGPTCCLGEEANPLLITTSLQEAVECNEVSPEPPFNQAEQSQLPQPFLVRLVLQTPYQFHCPSLGTFQGLNVFLVVRGPKRNTRLKTRFLAGISQQDCINAALSRCGVAKDVPVCCCHTNTYIQFI